MMDKLKIEDNEALVRDVKTNAVLNTDLDSLYKYKMKRKKEKEAENLKHDVASLKDEMASIKELLIQLVKEKN